MERLFLRTTAAVVGLVAAGVGLAGVAAAAPDTAPSPASSAPSSADPAPRPPALSDPAPRLLIPPIDASDGLLGVPRGAVPTASTPNLGRQIPAARRLPAVDLTPLPSRAPSDTASDTTSAAASDEEPATGP